MTYYILENDKPKKVEMMECAKWIEVQENTIIKKTKVGKAEVSTVFLGLDHNLSGRGDPLLFETMIFNHDGFCNYQKRYTSKQESLKGHEKAVSLVKKEKK